MGGCLSKWPGAPVDGARDPTAANAGSGAGGADYAVELSSYEAACRLDPELRTFDAALQQHTSRAISSLSTGVDLRSLSFSSLSVVTGSLLEMNQEVVKIVLECKQDIWRSPELFGLVEDYFNTSLHSLDFCTALEKCLKRARDGQLLIHLALQHFDEEDKEQDDEPNNGQSKYSRTLDELQHFKVAGDPFTEEFFQVFQSVYAQQLAMLNKLQQRKRKLDQKLRSVKVWRRVSSTIFAAAFATVLICSVVAAAMAAPPVAAALAAATAVPLGSMGKWFDSLWKNYEDALKGQNGVVSAMQVWTFITIKDLDGIRVLIDRLELQIISLLENAEFALRNEEAVRLAIEEIRKKLGEFMKSVEDLGEQADQCSRDIRKARTVILQRIIRHPK